MSQRLILHVGRHKTGTSAVQHHCSSVRETLKQQGVIYPVAGTIEPNGRRTPAHHYLARQTHRRHHDPDQFAALQRDFFAEIEGYDTVIVSSEGFQNLRRLNLLDRFFDGFEGFEVTVICYLREYLSYLVSSYRQMVQNQPRFMTFSDYCSRDFRIDDFLSDWGAVGTMITRPFDRDKLLGGDIVLDFFDQLGLESIDVEHRLVNHSIGGNLLYFRLAESHFDWEPTSYREAEKLATDHAPFRSGFRITDAQADMIRNSAPYNDIVADHVGALPLQSYADEPVIPAMATLDDDIRRVYSPERQQLVRERLLATAEKALGWFES